MADTEAKFQRGRKSPPLEQLDFPERPLGTAATGYNANKYPCNLEKYPEI